MSLSLELIDLIITFFMDYELPIGIPCCLLCSSFNVLFSPMSYHSLQMTSPLYFSSPPKQYPTSLTVCVKEVWTIVNEHIIEILRVSIIFRIIPRLMWLIAVAQTIFPHAHITHQTSMLRWQQLLIWPSLQLILMFGLFSFSLLILSWPFTFAIMFLSSVHCWCCRCSRGNIQHYIIDAMVGDCEGAGCGHLERSIFHKFIFDQF